MLSADIKRAYLHIYILLKLIVLITLPSRICLNSGAIESEQQFQASLPPRFSLPRKHERKQPAATSIQNTPQAQNKMEYASSQSPSKHF